ncbi:MAG: DUF4252 domain-containing protein [Bacteroidota bacterium]
MKKWVFSLLILWIGSVRGVGQSATVQSLKDSNRVQISFYFYPSTLRMLNFQNDPAISELIRDIQRLHLLSLRDDFTATEYYETIDQLLNEEGYEEYFIWDDVASEVQILGKASEQRIIGLANYEQKHYIVDLQGTVDLLKLPDFYRQMTQADSTKALSGFSFIFDNMVAEAQNKKEREQYEQEQAEAYRERARQKAQRDSLKQQ